MFIDRNAMLYTVSEKGTDSTLNITLTNSNIVLIFCKEYHEGNAKLLREKSPPHPMSVAILPCELDNGHVLQSAKS